MNFLFSITKIKLLVFTGIIISQVSTSIKAQNIFEQQVFEIEALEGHSINDYYHDAEFNLYCASSLDSVSFLSKLTLDGQSVWQIEIEKVKSLRIDIADSQIVIQTISNKISRYNFDGEYISSYSLEDESQVLQAANAGEDYLFTDNMVFCGGSDPEYYTNEFNYRYYNNSNSDYFEIQTECYEIGITSGYTQLINVGIQRFDWDNNLQKSRSGGVGIAGLGDDDVRIFFSDIGLSYHIYSTDLSGIQIENPFAAKFYFDLSGQPKFQFGDLSNDLILAGNQIYDVLEKRHIEKIQNDESEHLYIHSIRSEGIMYGLNSGTLKILKIVVDRVDLDGDGYSNYWDCDDSNPLIYPGGNEIPDNEVDEDCDGYANTSIDEDQDGYDSSLDCNDNDFDIHPDKEEIPYNGKDDDCNPATLDDDLDQDGFLLELDCDDMDPSINPSMAEIIYNGDDDDCNPATLDDDFDQDGYGIVEDCNDQDSTINEGAIDIINNNIDENCDKNLLVDTFSIFEHEYNLSYQGEIIDYNHTSDNKILLLTNQSKVYVFNLSGEVLNEFNVEQWCDYIVYDRLNNQIIVLQDGSEYFGPKFHFRYNMNGELIETHYFPLEGVFEYGDEDFEMTDDGKLLFVRHMFEFWDGFYNPVFILFDYTNNTYELNYIPHTSTSPSPNGLFRKISNHNSLNDTHINFYYYITASTYVHSFKRSNGEFVNDITIGGNTGHYNRENTSMTSGDNPFKGDCDCILNEAVSEDEVINLANDYWVLGPHLRNCITNALQELETDYNRSIYDNNIAYRLSGSKLYTLFANHIDADNDGFNSLVDCNDLDSLINFEAAEIPNNDIDENCDGIIGVDMDLDGYLQEDDCNDQDSLINPSATEIINNDIDENCDGIIGIDMDLDGYLQEDDCNDQDSMINPSAIEIINNDVDENCDGIIGIDMDLDGYLQEDDCNDQDSMINPAAVEILNNGIDDDCNPLTLDTIPNCYIESITLQTQLDIVNFINQYQDCNVIVNGDLNIFAPTFSTVDVSGLVMIIEVRNDLSTLRVDDLELSNLKQVGRNVWINQSLSSINIPKLEGVQNLNINNSGSFAFEELIQCNSFTLRNSNGTFSNMINLQTIKELKIESNPLITMLELNDSLSISDNLIIKNNINLSVCSEIPICNFINENSNYTIETNAPGCNSVAEIQENCTITSTINNHSSNITLYPNPTLGTLYLDNKDYENVEVTIYNALGERWSNAIIGKGISNFDMSHVDSGFYLVQLKGKNFTDVRKVVVK